MSWNANRGPRGVSSGLDQDEADKIFRRRSSNRAAVELYADRIERIDIDQRYPILIQGQFGNRRETIPLTGSQSIAQPADQAACTLATTQWSGTCRSATLP